MRTVCLVGLAPSSRDQVVDSPPGSEVWGLNQGHAYFSPQIMSLFTRWFQVHPYDEMAPRQNPKLGHLEWLAQATIPIYMEEPHPNIPRGVRYPYEDVCRTIGGNYLTSEPAFMLALAVHEGFDEIRIYGIDLDCDREWAYERACFEHLLGIAKGKGIRLWLPEGCPLLKGPLYAKTAEVPSSLLVEWHRQLEVEQAERVAQLNQTLGKIDILERLIDVAFKGKDGLGNARDGNIIASDGQVSVDPVGLMESPTIKTVQIA